MVVISTQKKICRRPKSAKARARRQLPPDCGHAVAYTLAGYEPKAGISTVNRGLRLLHTHRRSCAPNHIGDRRLSPG
jgi:hypothetical protein